jgi:hypothetical protein
MKLIPFSIAIVIAFSLCGCSKGGSYEARLRRTADTISAYTAKSAFICDAYGTAWNSAIDNHTDAATAIVATQRETPGMMKAIAVGKPMIDSMMKSVSDPPDDYRDKFQKVMLFYGNYSQLQALSEVPDGSLISFRNKINELEGEFGRMKNELRILDLLSADSTAR